MVHKAPGSYLVNQTLGGLLVRALRAWAGILLLINQLNLPESLKAYGPRFGGNGTLKYTRNHIFYCRISTLL